jgi:xylan 1,4-beta-xylosidase
MAAGSRPLYYTEWNISSNPRDPLHDQSFAAAYVVHILMSVADLVHGYSFWTFSDIFAENYFPSVPFHGGFGLLTLHAIAKPAYRAFELLHHLGTDRLRVDGADKTVGAWAARAGHRTTVLLANHAQPRAPIETKLVSVQLTHAPAPRTAHIERIDDTHANPRHAWIAMGQPACLTASEVDYLKGVSRLRREPIGWRYDAGTVHLDLNLPPHGVAALTLEFSTEPCKHHSSLEGPAT